MIAPEETDLEYETKMPVDEEPEEEAAEDDVSLPKKSPKLVRRDTPIFPQDGI